MQSLNSYFLMYYELHHELFIWVVCDPLSVPSIGCNIVSGVLTKPLCLIRAVETFEENLD